MTLWFDVEDLFHHGMSMRRPTGIQRLSFEIYRAFAEMEDADIRFVRHDQAGRSFQTTTWKELERVYLRMAHAPNLKPARRHASAPQPLTRGRLRPVAERIPQTLRQPIGEAIRAQVAALKAGWRAVRAVPELVVRTGKEVEAAPRGRPLADVAKPGDTLCALGSPWFHRGYGSLIEAAKQEMGLRFALLIYDLIPVVRSEFMTRDLSEHFARWYTACLPLADRVLSISEATARDVESWSERSGLPLARPVLPIRIGTGFSDEEGSTTRSSPALPLPAGLSRGNFVLLVSTIEARKNHALAFRVWRRLLADLPPARVPTLVFAGSVGWMVADLMQQIENSQHLQGKLVVLEGLSDSELASLYQGCRFTLFPSHYEGWGLPVTESLGFGKVCIASDRASMPEAGRDFCLYLDPDNVTGATELIGNAIRHPKIIEDLEAKIRREFHPTAWLDAAASVVSALR